MPTARHLQLLLTVKHHHTSPLLLLLSILHCLCCLVPSTTTTVARQPSPLHHLCCHVPSTVVIAIGHLPLSLLLPSLVPATTSLYCSPLPPPPPYTVHHCRHHVVSSTIAHPPLPLVLSDAVLHCLMPSIIRYCFVELGFLHYKC
jgi:hypothetical protein